MSAARPRRRAQTRRASGPAGPPPRPATPRSTHQPPAGEAVGSAATGTGTKTEKEGTSASVAGRRRRGPTASRSGRVAPRCRHGTRTQKLRQLEVVVVLRPRGHGSTCSGGPSLWSRRRRRVPLRRPSPTRLVLPSRSIQHPSSPRLSPRLRSPRFPPASQLHATPIWMLLGMAKPKPRHRPQRPRHPLPSRPLRPPSRPSGASLPCSRLKMRIDCVEARGDPARGGTKLEIVGACGQHGRDLRSSGGDDAGGSCAEVFLWSGLHGSMRNALQCPPRPLCSLAHGKLHIA
mmetsp:Transcript_6484/g.16610  ORF Transcript_6484/g.16610 Transcript_6484/m.16610 type:complete len:290 (+) Transcript_6484:817-1686(+)